MNFDVYKKKISQRRSDWHWRLTATNGIVIAESHRGFSSKASAQANAQCAAEGISKMKPWRTT